MEFFGLLEIINRLVNSNNPSDREVNEAVDIIREEQQINRVFFEKVTPDWLRVLEEKGIFGQTPEPIDEGNGQISFPWWAEGEYLKRVSGQKPNEVLAIIQKIKTENPRVAGCCIECLLAMRVDIAIRGHSLVMGFLEGQHRTSQFYDWFWVGGPAAKYMVKIAEADFGKAMAIAHRLLEIWPAKEGLERVQSRYHKHEYLELMRLVQRLWEVNPASTFGMMVQVMDRYLCEIQDANPNIYQMSFKLSIDDLENPAENAIHAQDVEVSLIQGICQAGLAVKDKQPDLIGPMLDDLEKRDKPIFRRIVLYLLRNIGPGREIERLNRLAEDQQLTAESIYDAEFQKLIETRWDELSSKTQTKYLKNIQDIVDKKIEEFVSGETWDERKYDKSDAQKMMAQWAVTKLFGLRNKRRDIFDQFRERAGYTTDDQAKPEPVFRPESRWVDPGEGAEYSEEEWLKLDPLEVVDICGDTTKEWKKTEKWVREVPGEGAQSNVLERVVKKRVVEYVQVEAGTIAAMQPAFLAAYFRAVWETIRQGNSKLDWNQLTGICSKVVELHHDKPSYRSALNGVCDVIKEMMDRDALRNNVIAGQIERFWAIVEPLTRYSYHPDTIVKPEEEKDPLNECINCVPGEAAQLAIRLGVIQRNRNQETYEQSLRPQIQGLLEWIVDHVQVAKIECVIGLWLPQLFYIEEDWMKGHLKALFDENKPRRWWAIWSTYIVWSRISQKAFEILKKAGIYESAVGTIGEKPLYHKRDTYEEGLMKQLMIAYFNGWMEYDDPLLQRFFEKADAKLRRQAAEFLTTGFASLKEDTKTEPEKKKEAIERLGWYWKKRLEAGKDSPEELAGFAQWVKDTPLDEGETLELLQKTLKLTKGKVGEWGRGLPDCIEGICTVGTGRELLALECLLLLAQNQDIVMNYSLVKERLDAFFREVVDLPETADRAEIWKKSMEFADRLGRMGKMDLRWVWKELKDKPGR
ncbi:MAG: hypothetical protein GX455_05470 [Phycisphaerae bacterium]|nr:hypothetical protein [Phycisphaerae bacterium]